MKCHYPQRANALPPLSNELVSGKKHEFSLWITNQYCWKPCLEYTLYSRYLTGDMHSLMQCNLHLALADSTFLLDN